MLITEFNVAEVTTPDDLWLLTMPPSALIKWHFIRIRFFPWNDWTSSNFKESFSSNLSVNVTNYHSLSVSTMFKPPRSLLYRFTGTVAGIRILQTALPVHGLGGVVLEPEDEGDIVSAAWLGHITGQHPRQPLEPRHRQDGN